MGSTVGVACLILARQSRRVLVRALTETSTHSAGQADTSLAELVTQTVRGGEGIFPALLARTFEQINLTGLF